MATAQKIFKIFQIFYEWWLKEQAKLSLLHLRKSRQLKNSPPPPNKWPFLEDQNFHFLNCNFGDHSGWGTNISFTYSQGCCCFVVTSIVEYTLCGQGKSTVIEQTLWGMFHFEQVLNNVWPGCIWGPLHCFLNDARAACCKIFYCILEKKKW